MPDFSEPFCGSVIIDPALPAPARGGAGASSVGARPLSAATKAPESTRPPLPADLPERGPDAITLRLRSRTWSGQFALWLAVSIVAGLPSLVTAITMQAYTGAHQIAAMVLGILMFAAGLTQIARLRRVRAILRHPYAAQTVRLGLIARGFVSMFPPLLMMMDVPLGWVSTTCVAGLLGGDTRTFSATLLITLVQGLLLSGLMVIFMLGVHWVRRAYLDPPLPLHAVPCPRCRYDLRGTEETRCPECGEAMPESVQAEVSRSLADLDSHLPEVVAQQGVEFAEGREHAARDVVAIMRASRRG